MHLTIFYPELNRFDIANGRPFSGAPAAMWQHRTTDLVPGLTIDLRLPQDYKRPLRKDTHVLGLGITPCNFLLGDANLNKHRGYRKLYQNRPTIVTYSHFDCWEFSGDEHDEAADEKNIGLTARANYLFWSIADFNKLLRPPQPHAPRQIQICPDIDKFIALLGRLPAGSAVIIDIETRIQDNTLDCIGFGFIVNGTVYVYTIPIYDHNNTLFYGSVATTKFWRALHVLLSRPDITIVGHNLSFDLSILHHYYHLPIPHAVHDTMLFMHRHHAYVDKSLSHAISYYTDATTNHKGGFCPNITADTFRQLTTYNAEDIYWTAEVYRRQLAMAPAVPGLSAAADTANAALVLCLTMSFTGIQIDTAALEVRRAELELELRQLARIAAILTGIPTFNPNSSQQVAGFLYGQLGYAVPEYTAGGAEATGEEVLYRLQLMQVNPIIPVILKYKSLQKELSTLNFVPYERHNP